jgi:hypothetical protein
MASADVSGTTPAEAIRTTTVRAGPLAADRASENPCSKDGPGRIRTSDLGIKSPLLCQLSYRPRRRV